MAITITPQTRKYLNPPTGDNHKIIIDVDKNCEHFVCSFPDCRPSLIRWASGFHERKQLVNGDYLFPLTDMFVERCHAAFNGTEQFKSDLAQAKYHEILLRGALADKHSEVYSAYKADGTIPKHKLELCREYPLKGYQQVALTMAMNNPGFGLFMEQGTGKTPVVIARICNEAKQLKNRMYRAIIVCPKNLRFNWESEFAKFTTQVGQITVLHGTVNERIQQIIASLHPCNGCKYTVTICSYESLARTLGALRDVIGHLCGDQEITTSEAMQKLPMLQFDLAVLDESHKIKNNSTQRAATSQVLRDMSKSRMCLTGTLICNKPDDAYPQFEFLGEGYSGFSSARAFQYFYGTYEKSASGYDVYTGMQNKPFFQERLARYTFAVKQKDVNAELPDRTYDMLEVSMSPQQKDIYCQVRDQLMLEIENAFNSGENRSMVINNTLTKLLRLAQITSGFINWSPVRDDDTGEILEEAKTDRFDPDNKLEELISTLKEKSPDDKTIVWAHWTQNIKTISARLKLEGIDHVIYYGQSTDEQRKEAEYRYNFDPACRVFVGNPSACAEGLNLLGYPPGKPEGYTTNTTHQIYYSSNWSMTARDQSEKRGANRIGSRLICRISDLVVPRTIDVEIRNRVLLKRKSANEIQDIRSILNALKSGEITND